MENDLIRRSDALNLFKIHGMVVQRDFKDIPAVDAVEVRYGRWIVYEVANTDEEQPIAWECSECGEVVEAKHNYCPNCGAKMEVQDG